MINLINLFIILIIVTNIFHIILLLLNNNRISFTDSNFDKVVNVFIIIVIHSLFFLLIYDYNFKIDYSTVFNLSYLIVSNALFILHTMLDIFNYDNKVLNLLAFIVLNTVSIAGLYLLI